MNIRTDEELEEHFARIGKAHWLNFDEYANKKIKAYVEKTSPHLLSSKGQDILDIGPGPGHYSYFLKKRKHNVSGIDRKILDKTMACYSYLSKKYDLGHIYEGIESFADKKNFGFNKKFNVINIRGALGPVLVSVKNKYAEDGIGIFFKQLANSLIDNSACVILSVDERQLKNCLAHIEGQG